MERLVLLRACYIGAIATVTSIGQVLGPALSAGTVAFPASFENR
jgi:hypothetical protein